MTNDRIQTLSTEQMQTACDDPGTMILDIRPIDAFNGWRLGGEIRGGHIAGAHSLPAKWADYIDWMDILQAKKITKDRPVALYGYDPEETLRVAEQFQRIGFERVSCYHDFVREWSGHLELPLQRLPRYRHLVPASWLLNLLCSRKVEDIDNDEVVVCHCHFRNPDDYHSGHIPGSISLDTEVLEAEETWNRRSPAELRAALAALGITADTTVICYGRFGYPDNDDPWPGSSAGHLGAFRCAMIMLYAGIRDVRMLNGGLQAWEDAGFPISTTASLPDPIADVGLDVPGRPELIIDLPQAQEYLQAEDANLVCVRSWPEYIGEVSGYHYIEAKGRIPGCVFADCGSDAYHMENFRNLDHTTRECHEIEHMLVAAGIRPEHRNAFYCGTGWRGSEACFNAWLLGWPQVALFDGGWFEWSNAGLPSEHGMPRTHKTEMRV
ncbi:MAG: rhodanese-like domain-containing protein [Planctomycetota bacterium]